MNRSFSSYPWKTGQLAVLGGDQPSVLGAWERAGLEMSEGQTHFGYVHKYEAELFSVDRPTVRLKAGMFFCIPGRAIVRGGCGIVISRLGYHGAFSVGGPLERTGRLKYIDGCTDSLLVPPVKKGDPCLNLLHFPPGIDQTMHTHPSDRIGIVLSGRGACDTPDGIITLVAGMIFCIHAGGEHRFKTPPESEMRVLAFHPDSDFGPTDECHPMLNRTIIDGVSAADPARSQYRTA